MTTRAKAGKLVDAHVSHKECFVTTDNGKDWRPLDGTGCAHFVAHRLGVRKGAKGSTACMEGYTLRVPMLVDGMSVVPADEVKVNDVWANKKRDHCGVVTTVEAGAKGAKARIAITHCASNKHRPGGPGIHTDDWRTYFHAQGTFYRPAGSPAPATANGGGSASLGMVLEAFG